MGACAARNTGFSNSNGKYIAFLDDDDEWVKDKIEKQLDVFRKSKNISDWFIAMRPFMKEMEAPDAYLIDIHRIGDLYISSSRAIIL